LGTCLSAATGMISDPVAPDAGSRNTMCICSAVSASGIARVKYRNEDGTDSVTTLYAGDAYHIPCGAAHQVTAVTDCIFFECGLPVFEDRIAVE
jgi:hypothetical protein